MYPENAGNAKMQAQKAYDDARATQPIRSTDTCQGVVGVGRPFSLQEEASQCAQNHYEQASKAQSAAVFFANNPAFEDFIRLVRSGAIQF